MKKPKLQPLPDFDAHEVGFNVEAIRGYLNSACLEVLEGLQEQQVAHADAALLTGVLEAAAQIWAQVSYRAQVPPMKARTTFEAQARKLFIKWMGEESRKADQKAYADPDTKQ